MQKMEYRRPAADLILFENEDVIMTSGGQQVDPGHDPTCPYEPGHVYYLWIPFVGWVKTGFLPCLCWIHDGTNFTDAGPYSGAETFDNTEDFDDFGGWSD